MSKKEIGRIVRFSLSGILVVASDLGTYHVLNNFMPNPVAKGISFTIGGIVSYVLNKYWTFKQKRRSASEVIKFLVVNGVIMIFNILVNQTVLHFKPEAVTAAVNTATLVTGVVSYFVFKYWIFSD